MKILKRWISQQILGFILGIGILRPFLESEYLWVLLTEVGNANSEPMASGVTGWDLEKQMKKIYSSLVPLDELFLNRFRTGEAVSALRARGISLRDWIGGKLLHQLCWKCGRGGKSRPAVGVGDVSHSLVDRWHKQKATTFRKITF